MHTNRLIYLFCFVLCLPPLFAAAAEDTFSKQVPIAADGKVFVKNLAGDIHIETWDKNEVLIKAEKSGHNQNELDRVYIDVQSDPQVCTIKTRYESKGDVDVSVSFHLQVPKGVSIEANSISGDFYLSRATGPVQVEVISGTITINNLANRLLCRSVSGDILVETLSGACTLKSVSGEIVLKDVTGPIAAHSVSSDIVIENAGSAAELTVVTVSGDMIYRGKITPDGHISLKSHSGDIHMEIPTNSAFELNASTYSGRLSLADAFTIKNVTSRKKTRLSGVVNGGGSLVRVNTFSGSLNIEAE